MTMITGSTGFETSDLSLAAFLVARGYPLASVDGQPGGRRVFRFSPEVHDEAQAFYRNAAVPARAFANALRDLKALIRER